MKRMVIMKAMNSDRGGQRKSYMVGKQKNVVNPQKKIEMKDILLMWHV
jgi:hypothetical protein